jgi:hypothetical protein
LKPLPLLKVLWRITISFVGSDKSFAVYYESI